MTARVTTFSRHLSLFGLLALVVLIGIFFFQIIQPFAVALFIAAVLAVLFQPVHHQMAVGLGNRMRIAAGITTAFIVFLVIAPLGMVLLMAGGQLATVAKEAVVLFDDTDGAIENSLEGMEETALGKRVDEVFRSLSPSQQRRLHEGAVKASEGFAADLYKKTGNLVSDAVAFVIGLAVMTLGLYYFLADGRTFLVEIHRLLPFEKGEERDLLAQFQAVCRGVVFGTIVAGAGQAALAGIAFAIIGVPQLWLLIVLTMVCSLIPLVGAAAVWLPVAIALAFDDRYIAAICLLVFGSLVISTVDNLIRAYVIGSQAEMHPLIALVSVLGAVQWMGLWGIFIGPMLAAFFYALAQILRNRILAETAVEDPT